MCQVETSGDKCEQNLKLLNLKENIAFETFRPIVLVSRKGRSPKTRGEKNTIRNRLVGKT